MNSTMFTDMIRELQNKLANHTELTRENLSDVIITRPLVSNNSVLLEVLLCPDKHDDSLFLLTALRRWKYSDGSVPDEYFTVTDELEPFYIGILHRVSKVRLNALLNKVLENATHYESIITKYLLSKV